MPEFEYTELDHRPNEDLPKNYKDAAEQLLGKIEWINETEGYCQCPGVDAHTKVNNRKDCKIMIDGAPTINCHHSSCNPVTFDYNRKIRSLFGRIDKANNPSGNYRPSNILPFNTPSDIADNTAKALRDRLHDICKGRLCDTPSPIPDTVKGQFHAHLSLFEETEWIWHGDTYNSTAAHIRPAKAWKSYSNPIGQFISHSTFKPDSEGRKNENVDEVKYLVVESDDLTKEQQMGIFSYLRDWCRWDLRMVIDTGGKSLHAWFHWPTNLNDYQIKAILKALDCDEKLLTPSQPSRVAGAKRDDKRQAILWFSATPSETKPKTFEEICLGSSPDADILNKLKSVAFNFEQAPPAEECTYAINGTEVAHPGNVETITAAQASGKSSFTAAGIAAPMGAADRDYLGWQSSNPKGYAMIHFDTEQSTYDHDKLIRRSIKRAGIDKPPDWFSSYSLVGWDTTDMIKALHVTLTHAKFRFGGIHSLWLDGIADYVSSVNEEAECMDFIRRLHALAKEFETVIWNILHLNPGSDFKSRGHLGSQIERKSETVIQLKKDGDEIVAAYTTKSRRAPISEKYGARFKWCDLSYMHVSTSTKIEESIDQLKTIRDAVWKDPERGFGHGELVQIIMDKTGKRETTATNQIKEMKHANIIKQNPISKNYHPFDQ